VIKRWRVPGAIRDAPPKGSSLSGTGLRFSGVQHRFRSDTVVNTRNISGRVDNGNVVSETFARQA
jgi:hypothetical protein